ncbi:hypothetical protein SOASR030_04480 [Leminorella grimontii]|uniref:Uncharacterized protein n=1 Tax=Leminorella grimontii TaxID=82981 RepID=A0AAV5MWW8_9GAMM|nr:hypothetical protein SOASR030_04480 [Leminorella grimontii]
MRLNLKLPAADGKKLKNKNQSYNIKATPLNKNNNNKNHNIWIQKPRKNISKSLKKVISTKYRSNRSH